jgi:hypothetical protein
MWGMLTGMVLMRLPAEEYIIIWGFAAVCRPRATSLEVSRMRASSIVSILSM